MRIDEKNKTTKWKDAEETELSQIDEYNIFEDKGKAILDKKGRVMNLPKGYKKI